MTTLERICLENEFVRLEPLEAHHREALRGPANDPDLWAYATRNQHAVDFDDWFSHRLDEGPAAGDMTFAIYDKRQGLWAGSSSYLMVVLAHKKVEIGWTWYAKPFWSTAINPATKLLLMEYGFETLGLKRIEFKVDSLNERSLAAVAKIGAKREGTHRNHFIMPDGRLRHSVYFSVIAQEWYAVKTTLQARLMRFASKS